MTFKTIYLLLIVILLAGPSLQTFGQNETNYPIGPKDLLKISVFNVPELNITIRVAEDGNINLPLLGNIKVSGLTLPQLQQKLETLLEKNYLKNAQVTVFIQEYQSQKISIMGAVIKPGYYELVGRNTLLELLSMAGGLSESAADRIVVIRQHKDGKSSSLIIDLEELMLKGNPKLNIPLQAGDIVNVPLEQLVDIYILGEVNRPGCIKLKKFGQVTLLRAIAQAGGFSQRARKSGVTVTRTVNGKEEKFKVNVNKILGGKINDFILLANDVVNVPESIL